MSALSSYGFFFKISGATKKGVPQRFVIDLGDVTKVAKPKSANLIDESFPISFQ
jgi:hypothetical protein